MKHDPKIITVTFDLWFKELSYRKISDHIKQFHNMEICQITLMRWIKQYMTLPCQIWREAQIGSR
jgi:transposase-like protein